MKKPKPESSRGMVPFLSFRRILKSKKPSGRSGRMTRMRLLSGEATPEAEAEVISEVEDVDSLAVEIAEGSEVVIGVDSEEEEALGIVEALAVLLVVDSVVISEAAVVVSTQAEAEAVSTQAEAEEVSTTTKAIAVSTTTQAVAVSTTLKPSLSSELLRMKTGPSRLTSSYE